ncbi:MAG: ribonuclease III domain-containing protein, partial [Clostridia bacterium]|nr:ribonuclease III domain-containing protein [Clostridia bacterium]
YFLTKGIIKPQQLHLNTVSVVRAPNQAIISHRIEDELTETELDFFRRGRNAKSGHQPPGATVGEYRRATGLEALLGYWYLSGRNERLNWFFNKIFSA